MRPELVGSLLVFLLVFLIVFFSPRRRQLSAAVALTALGSIFISELMLPFMIGMAAALVHYSWGDRIKQGHLLSAVLVAAGIWFAHPHVDVQSHTLAGLCFIAVALYDAPLRNVLRRPLFQALGRLSFPVYLVHGLALTIAAPWAYILLVGKIATPLLLLAVFAIYAAVTLALDWPVERFEVWWVRLVGRTATSIVGALTPSGWSIPQRLDAAPR